MENNLNEEMFGDIPREIKEPLNWELIPAKDLATLDIPEPEFLIKPYIPETGFIILAGESGIGKSWLIMQMAKSIGAGSKFLGEFDTKKTKILYIDEESHIREVKERWLMLEGDNNADVTFMSYQGVKIDDPVKRAKLLGIVKEEGYKLIIFDTYRATMNCNEQDSTETQKVIDGFREFQKEGVTILALHHNRKDSNKFSSPKDILRGSNALVGALNSLITLFPKDRKTITEFGQAVTETTLVHAKSKSSLENRAIDIDRILDNGKMSLVYKGLTVNSALKIQSAKDLIISELEGGETISSVLKNVCITEIEGISKSTVDRAIKQLVDSQMIEKGTGNKAPYKLVEDGGLV